MNSLPLLRQRSRRLHRYALWPALSVLTLFIASGFLHVVMTWTGPQSNVAQPPQARFSAAEWQAIPRILQQHGIAQAQVIKLIPSNKKNLLQVTVRENEPRRYFDLVTGDALPDQDVSQAVWLAQYYLQDAQRLPVAVEFLTHFDAAYPAVNRLLPVYRVQFGGPEPVTLTVHTETGALADISNAWKRGIQTAFRQLHTAAWLTPFPALHTALFSGVLLLLLTMILAGAVLLFAGLRRRATLPVARWHRRLAHALWLPLCGFVFSGLYHVLHTANAASDQRDIRLPLTHWQSLSALAPVNPAALPATPLHAVSVLFVTNQQGWYRASVGGHSLDTSHSAHHTRQVRFDGVPREQSAVYLDAATGQRVAMDDDTVVHALVQAYLGPAVANIVSTDKLTRFGEGYDFRNKRLPVWRVALDTPDELVLYVDVTTGMLVDRSTRDTRQASALFTTLHKWAPLVSLTGRAGRDVLMVVTLLSVLLLALLGVWLSRKTTRR